MKNSKQETSIDWFLNELKNTFGWQNNLNEEDLKSFNEIVSEAKQMEKELIIAARMDGMSDNALNRLVAEQYYSGQYK